MNDSVDPRLDAIVGGLYRVAAKVLLVRDRKLLVVNETEKWYGVPGGGIEHGENLVEGMLREVEEEIGLELPLETISEKPIIISNAGVVHGIPRLTLYYTCTLPSDARLNILQKELNSAWVTSSELLELPLGPNINEVKREIARYMDSI